jgi:hypothetical protein
MPDARSVFTNAGAGSDQVARAGRSRRGVTRPILRVGDSSGEEAGNRLRPKRRHLCWVPGVWSGPFDLVVARRCRYRCPLLTRSARRISTLASKRMPERLGNRPRRPLWRRPSPRGAVDGARAARCLPRHRVTVPVNVSRPSEASSGSSTTSISPLPRTPSNAPVPLTIVHEPVWV